VDSGGLQALVLRNHERSSAQSSGVPVAQLST
jgi:hypothetical protein